MKAIRKKTPKKAVKRLDDIMTSIKGIDRNWVITVDSTFPNRLTITGSTNEAIPTDNWLSEKITPICASVAYRTREKYTLKKGTATPAPNPIIALQMTNCVTKVLLPANGLDT